MVFSSLTFLFAYLPIVLAVYYISPWKWRNIVLFLVSLFFYGWGEPIYILLMLFSILLNWMTGICMQKYEKSKKRILIISIVMNLVLLGFFKYWDFIAGSLAAFGLNFLPVLHLSLPIGISFYTFQAMSYPIDLYRKDTSVQKNFVNFGAYVTMFPQLIAGPIVRYRDVADQLEERTLSVDKFSAGITRFVAGLAKKILLANQVGQIYESIQTLSASQTSVITTWIGVACYTLQIYFDFSGYSDMAIGLGKMLGFDFLENFNYPYISASVTEFWRRWHMSLSFWFRDYVYIPLGGNRHGKTRQILNIMIVWLLTGLWHGASWNFVVWGLYYGVLLLIEKLFLYKYLQKMPKWVSHVYTMVIVMIGWVFFSHLQIQDAFHTITMMFGNASAFANDITVFYLRNYFVLFVVSILACTPLAKTKLNFLCSEKGRLLQPAVVFAVFLICVAFVVDGTYNPFLYFRF